MLSLVLLSCTKNDNDAELSQADQQAVITAMFNVSSDGLKKGSTPEAAKQKVKPIENVTNVSYPLDNDFTYTYSDTKGGSVELTVNTGGYFNYNTDPFAFTGGFIIISIDEKFNNFHVGLTNGREVIVSTSKAITFSGNFYVNSDYSYDAAKSFFNMGGTYMVNGIEYNFNLIGSINANGTCKHIGGIINGKTISFDY